MLGPNDVLNIQLNLEQHEFELCKPTYTWIFFSTVHTTVLSNPRLVESQDATGDTGTQLYVIGRLFTVQRVTAPKPHVVRGSTVSLLG